MEVEKDGIQCSQFIFYNEFDSANLSRVEFVPQSEIGVSKSASSNKTHVIELPDAEFNLWTRPDCEGTQFENGNRTWFYFGVKAPRAGLMVRFNLVDLNKQGKMYSQGMAPVCRILPGKPKWERIWDKPVYNFNDDIFTLSFKFRTPENLESCTYFAFTYPFSYSDLEKMVVNIDAKYLAMQPVCEDDIYYVRETVCRSLEGRNVDLITITSYHGITIERESRLKNLFPVQNAPRPHKFVGKKVIFISARVHPGEVPSSFVFNGLLQLLLTRDDLQAQYLRKLYVFKLIPFLNPDGVARGHYRTDTRGVNLNRMYLNPSIAEHPSIYAARALIRYHHFGVEKEDKVPKCQNCHNSPPLYLEASQIGENTNKMSSMSLAEDGNATWCSKWHNFCRQCGSKLVYTESKEEIKFETVTIGNHGDIKSNESGLFLYLDLHGHASKKGIFMYGNHFDDIERRVECMLLPKLMGLNNHHFHFQACNFTERNMYLRDKRDGMSRAGSGRVAVLSLTGIIKSYTLECNYNTGKFVNVLPPTVRESPGKMHTLPVPPKYTPQIFEEVGKAVGASILDLTGQNPFSRLPNSEFHNLGGVRDFLRNSCNSFSPMEGKPKMSRVRNQNAGQNSQAKTSPGLGFKRSPLKPTKKMGKSRANVPIDRKENLVCHYNPLNQPSGSKSSLKLTKPMKAKSRKDLSLKTKNVATSTDKIIRTKKPPNSIVHNRGRNESNKKTDPDKSESKVRLQEICFIKSTEGKTMIAKYKNNKEGEAFDDSLIVSWDAPTSKATVYTHKSAPATSRFLFNKSPSEPGTSKQTGTFRVHSFAKATLKSKLKKTGLRRLASTTDITKSEKKKKRKLRLKPSLA